MKIAVLKEETGETRCAASPETVKKFAALGAQVAVEKGAGESPDLSLMLGPAEFLKLITGTGNPAMMFMMGKVKASGDLGLASGLANWFEAPKG